MTKVLIPGVNVSTRFFAIKRYQQLAQARLQARQEPNADPALTQQLIQQLTARMQRINRSTINPRPNMARLC